MRISESNMADQYLTIIGRTRERMTLLQSQIASGKRVLKVSDDPQAANSILRLNALISSNEQYKKNTDETQSMMEATMNALDGFSTTLSKIKETVAQATNGGNTSEMSTFASNVDQMLSELLSYANTNYNGKYIFGGTNTQETPFTMSAGRVAVTANPNGITGAINIPVAEGRTQSSNIDGQTAFQGTAIFDMIIRLRNSLNSKSAPDPADAKALDDAYSHVVGQTGNAGLIVDQLTNHSTYLDSQKTQLDSLLSMQNDTDVAAAITRLKLEETNLQAALNVTAQIIPKSLLDYLR